MPVIRFKNSHLPEDNSLSCYLKSVHTGTAKINVMMKTLEATLLVTAVGGILTNRLRSYKVHHHRKLATGRFTRPREDNYLKSKANPNYTYHLNYRAANMTFSETVAL